MTFENNQIVDIKGMCEVFKALRGFEKLESLNFRCNTNFTDEVIAALSEGITLKKELRVSQLDHNPFSFSYLFYRPLTSAKIKYQTKAS
jgi:hypothetical protein